MRINLSLFFKQWLPFCLLVAAVLVVALVKTDHKLAARVTKIKSAQSSTQINLLDKNWDYAPGVSQTANGLHIAPTDFRIVQQDGSGGQTNPPLNLYSTHLQTSGDFQISLAMKNISGACSVQLYSSPPNIADEFRVETPSLRLTETATGTQVQVWNGSTTNLANQTPFYSKTVAQNSGNITFSKTGPNTSVTASGQSLSIPGNVLNKGVVWLGIDSTGGCDINPFTAQGSVKVVNAIDNTYTPAKDGLQALADQKRPGFKVGASVALGPIVSDSTYANELVKNFGSITSENAMKWQFIEPSPGQFSFQQADALVNFAQKNGMVVHGHTLVFSEANPKWVQDLSVSTAADKQKVQSVMLNHISAVVGHYKGKVATWDVVNEPLQDYDTFDPSSGQILRHNKWFQAMGNDYIVQAFQAAHTADPNAKLYINEYGLEADGERWDNFLSLVKNLKAAGVPIDGVGFESHVYVASDKIDPAVLRSHFDQLAKIGIKSRVSEMDVYDDDGQTVQAQQFASIFQACLADSNCVSFTTWGVDDRYDVFQDDKHQLQHGKDFLFDRGKATPAYQAIKAIL